MQQCKPHVIELILIEGYSRFWGLGLSMPWGGSEVDEASSACLEVIKACKIEGQRDPIPLLFLNPNSRLCQGFANPTFT